MTMNNLKLSLIQTDLYWEDTEKNIEKFTNKINSIKEETDIIIIPEMFNTGFSMNPRKLATDMQSSLIDWYFDTAAEKNTAIVASSIIKHEDEYFNRLMFSKGDGKLNFYDKRHLFRMGREHEHYSPGDERLIVDYKGWRILPLICYDLRFPVWSRNLNDYDLLIYIANWPESRREVWKTLLKARAIENQCYVAAVNRIGKDGTGVSYSGDSVVINPKGEVMTEDIEYKDTIIHAELSAEELVKFRKKFPVHKDADKFKIIK